MALSKLQIEDNSDYFLNIKSNNSFIGVFYYYKHNFYYEYERVGGDSFESNISINGLYKFYNLNHSDFFNKIKSKKSKDKFNEFPRGRVICSTKNNNFKIYINEQLLDKMDFIIKEFNLPKDVDIIIEDNYKC